MKQALQLKLGQSLSMTPQMQQAIRMLQLSTMELRTEIQQIIETNPFLEVEESTDTALDPNTDVEQDLTSHDEYEQRLFEQAEWQSASVSRNSKMGSATDDTWLDNKTSSDTLQDHLLWQLEMGHFSAKDQVIGNTLIESIDERGLLSDSLESLLPTVQSEWDEIKIEIQQQLTAIAAKDQHEAEHGLEDENSMLQTHQKSQEETQIIDENSADWQSYFSTVTLEDLQIMLLRIQHFDPPGVGARDLNECLRLQLKALPGQTPCVADAIHLLEHHSDALASQNLKLLLKNSGLTQERATGALELLRTLDVSPGERSYPSDTEYVIPDVIAYKLHNRWQVILNPETAPKLRMNPAYENLQPKQMPSHEQDYVKTHIQDAKWFLKSLQSRHDTLLKIATDIVACQEAFFEEGEVAMKPMILADVAQRVEMHESTISRVTTQKYIHTPRGVFELKYFFSSHVSTDDGGECSSTAIRAKIKQLIEKEAPEKPLSDSKLAQLLEKAGINIARRTVAKYRELDKIPSSSDRKRTF